MSGVVNVWGGERLRWWTSEVVNVWGGERLGGERLTTGKSKGHTWYQLRWRWHNDGVDKDERLISQRLDASCDTSWALDQIKIISYMLRSLILHFAMPPKYFLSVVIFYRQHMSVGAVNILSESRQFWVTALEKKVRQAFPRQQV